METHRVQVNETESIVVDWQAPAMGQEANCAVFIHGLGSDRKGEKAEHFRAQFNARGWGFLALDMRGHGEADGALRDLKLTLCLQDLAAALGWMRAQCPQAERPVLIGSSMGGAVAVWHHMANPRAHGPLVLIAPALTFPGRLSWQLGPAEMEKWKAEGVRRFDSDWIDLEIGFGLIEDGLNYDPQKLLKGYAAPTLILHGMKDDAVDWRGSLTFVEDCPYPQIDLLLFKSGDHRLSAEKALLFDAMWGWLEERDRKSQKG